MFIKLYKVVLAFKYASVLKRGLFSLHSQGRSYFLIKHILQAKFAVRVTKLVERGSRVSIISTIVLRPTYFCLVFALQD